MGADTVIRTHTLDSQVPLWLAARGQRPGAHIILVCPSGKTREAVAHLVNLCQSPFHFCRMPGPLALPTTRNGTLVLTNFTELRLDQQLALYDWLDGGPGGVRVIATTDAPPELLVEEGRFFEALYSRLNTIRIEVEAAKEEVPSRPRRWIDTLRRFREKEAGRVA